MHIKETVRGSLRRRMVLASVFIALIPLIAIFTFIVVQNRNSLVERQRQSYQTLLDTIAGSVNRCIMMYEQAADFVAKDSNIVRGLCRPFFFSLQTKAVFYVEAEKALANARLAGGDVTLYYSNPNLFEFRSIRPFPQLAQYGSLLEEDSPLRSTGAMWLQDFQQGEDGPAIVYLQRISLMEPYTSALSYQVPIRVLSNLLSTETADAYRLSIVDACGQEVILRGDPAVEETTGPLRTLEYRLDSGHVLLLCYAEQGLSSSEQVSLALIALAYLFSAVAVGMIMALTIRRMTASLESFINKINRMDTTKLETMEALLATTTGKDDISIINRKFVALIQHIQTLNNMNLQALEKSKLLEVSLTQAKLNPHLLYNSLSVIKWQAMMKDVPEIAQLVDTMTRYYRAVLGKGDNIVTIRHELALVMDYVKIVEFAHATSYNLIVDIPQPVQDAMILKLLIQPVVENAILHGLNGKEGNKCIEIRGRQSDGIIELIVADNGYGIGADTLERLRNNSYVGTVGGFGIRSIEEQLQASFGGQYGILVDSVKDQFTRVTIHIPNASREEWLGKLRG